MSEWDDKELRRWLDAEAAGASDAADQLFAALASSHLPRFGPPSGFADRVLQALPAGVLVPARPFFDLAASWWVRLVAFASVILLGLGLALVTPRHIISLSAEALSLAARLLDGAVAWGRAGIGVWTASLELLGTVGQAAGHVAMTGTMPLLIAANIAVASAAFVGLRRLLPPREECV
jgi:hypothetical protein